MKAVCEGGARAQAGETAARVRSILINGPRNVLRVATDAAGSGSLNYHGRGPVPLSCAPSQQHAHFAVSTFKFTNCFSLKLKPHQRQAA
jgi:hypothetical protein